MSRSEAEAKASKVSKYAEPQVVYYDKTTGQFSICSEKEAEYSIEQGFLEPEEVISCQ